MTDKNTAHCHITRYNYITLTNKQINKTQFITPVYGWGSTASTQESLQGDSLLFSTNDEHYTFLNFFNQGTNLKFDFRNIYKLSNVCSVLFITAVANYLPNRSQRLCH